MNRCETELSWLRHWKPPSWHFYFTLSSNLRNRAFNETIRSTPLCWSLTGLRNIGDLLPDGVIHYFDLESQWRVHAINCYVYGFHIYWRMCFRSFSTTKWHWGTLEVEHQEIKVVLNWFLYNILALTQRKNFSLLQQLIIDKKLIIRLKTSVLDTFI